jgi:2'-5' RNA ligase
MPVERQHALVVGVVVLMDQQLSFLQRDPTLHNVFFAALPDPATVSSTRQTAGSVRQCLRTTTTLIAPERLHVTLLPVGGFSGSYPRAVIDAAMLAARTVSMAPFKVEFDRIATFSGGRGKQALVLTGNDDAVAGFVMLQKAPSQAMAKTGLRLRQPSGFSPHLTMMYANQRLDCPIQPISWTVNRFVLVDSLVGQSRHVHLGQWPLTSRSTTVH